MGESDTFEYSKALARKYPSYRIVATRYGSGAPPSDVPANMFVVDNVDATNLPATLANTAAADLKFDATVFNNPFTADSSKATGSDPYKGVAKLIIKYWESAGEVLSPDGTIRVNINPQLVAESESLGSVLSKGNLLGSFGSDEYYAPFTGMSSKGTLLRDTERGPNGEQIPRQGSGLNVYDLPVSEYPSLPEE